MHDLGIPPKVRAASQVRLIDGDLLEKYARMVLTREVNAKQHRSVQNFTESAMRLCRKRQQVADLGKPWGPPTRLSEAQQHELYDLTESYFQGFYNTLSKLAAVTVVFPDVFPGMPVRSMEKFLKRLRENPIITAACDELERARTYRAQLDHPAGAPVSNWMSTRMPDDRGVVFHHYGNFGQSGKMPDGASTPPPWFPFAVDWYIDPPFVPYVDEALGTVTGHVFVSIAQHQKDQASR